MGDIEGKPAEIDTLKVVHIHIQGGHFVGTPPVISTLKVVGIGRDGEFHGLSRVVGINHVLNVWRDPVIRNLSEINGRKSSQVLPIQREGILEGAVAKIEKAPKPISSDLIVFDIRG